MERKTFIIALLIAPTAIKEAYNNAKTEAEKAEQYRQACEEVRRISKRHRLWDLHNPADAALFCQYAESLKQLRHYPRPIYPQ